jgi:hypothetical protein
MTIITNNSKNNVSRRKFIKTLGASAAGFVAAPFIGGVRRAHAAHGSAQACIRFYLSGGARTSAMWDSNHIDKYNPYGTKYTTPPSGVASDFFVSDLWPDNIIEVLPDISVVRTMYHGDGVGTGHGACRQRVLTGGIDFNLPGWATVINRELDSLIPSVLIGNNGNASQLGSLGAAYASLTVPNARSVASLATSGADITLSEALRIRKLRNALSLRAIRQVGSKQIRDLPFHQTNAESITTQIAQPYFNITAAGDEASIGTRLSDDTPVTNAELRALFGVNGNGGGNGYGEKAMSALRLVQSGVRSVTITNGGWDTHGNEAARFNNSVPALGNAIHGLITTLKDLPSISIPPKANLLEDVLIVVDTEFARDNTGDNGFNNSDGSDHSSRYAKYFSAMFAGGGVAGGQALGTTDSQFVPSPDEYASTTYHSSRINTTIYDLLGIESGKYLSEPSIEELYA